MKTNKLLNNIRKNPKPFLIELNTFRDIEHCGPNNDDNLNYRDNKYLNLWKNKCPINTYEKTLIKNDSNFLNKKIL